MDKANLVGKNLCQGKYDYETGGIFYGLFLAPKTKYVLTINEFCIVLQLLTFKGFNDSKRLLDRSLYFNMLEGKKISAMLPRSWPKSFNNGSLILTKLRRFNDWKDRIQCTTCNNQIDENKEFEANVNELKRHPHNEFGHKLPYYKL